MNKQNILNFVYIDYEIVIMDFLRRSNNEQINKMNKSIGAKNLRL